jgi:O-antigen/teichoic acid export membrane protein
LYQRYSSLAAEFALFAVSVAIFQGSRLLLNMVGAAELSASDFNTWVLVLTALGYAPFLLVGITNGMNRVIPVLLGKNLGAEAERAEQAAWVVVLWVAGTLLVAGLFSALANSILAFALLAASLTIAYQAQQFGLRSRFLFNRASAQQLIGGIALIVCAGLLWLHGSAAFSLLMGLYIIALGFVVVSGAVLRRPVLPKHDRRLLAEMITTGFPMMLIGLVFSFLITADRWIATVALGPRGAAPYALASLVASVGLLIPNIVAQQVYPRMARAFGRNESASGLLRMASQQGVAAAGLTVPAAFAVVFFMAVVIPRVVPQYDVAALPASIIALGLVPLALFTGYGNFLNVVGAYWAYLRIQMLALVLALILMWIGVQLLALPGLALGLSLSLLTYGLMVRATAIAVSHQDRIP